MWRKRAMVIPCSSGISSPLRGVGWGKGSNGAFGYTNVKKSLVSPANREVAP